MSFHRTKVLKDKKFTAGRYGDYIIWHRMNDEYQSHIQTQWMNRREAVAFAKFILKCEEERK